MSETTSRNGNERDKPIAIYYEQPNWFVPLFKQMDARGVNWTKLDARYHQYDAASPEHQYSLLFNRMSPSAWQRGLGHAIFYTVNYLAHLEAQGVRVVNGSRCFRHEISKALQLTNLEKLGLPYPKARVIHHPSQALEAAEAVGYPVVVQSLRIVPGFSRRESEVPVHPLEHADLQRVRLAAALLPALR